MKEPYGDVQETCFYDILAAEGSQKQFSALPPSTGINKTYAPHRARGSHFWYLQPLQRENAQRVTHALHPQEQKV